ncbi:hypothetical protein KCU81_g9172, partial [Aureobasidium melanogenum]|uniref:Uncharacterized protein n=1 Tax=Aureobasidium melanogenum (strain CBS 110374) TaxID=1043003 RepID=A0A074VZF8_AURM1
MKHSQYETDYQNAKTAIDAGNMTDGLAACESLLTDPDLPRYYRIKTLILLASATKEWRQKESLRLRAEHTWTESRRLHPEGQNTTTDTVLAELRESLDELKTEQQKTMPPDYEDELSAVLAETEIEDLADIADGEIETLADEEYARDQRASDEPLISHTASAVVDVDTAEQEIPSSSPNSSFAPASSLKASQEILAHHVRDGQTAGSRMVHRIRGVGRRAS